MAYTSEQRKVQSKIVRIGQKRGMPRKAILSALATGAVESSFRNLSYGDRDSQGWRQERAQYYKNPTNLSASINRYYDEWKADAPKKGPIGPMAQAVQQSGFPGRYQEHAHEAVDILKSLNRGGKASFRNGRSSSTRIPGVNNAGARKQLLLQYLATDYDPNALLSLATGLKGAQDIPGVTVPGHAIRGRGRDVVTATGQSVNQMLHKATKWDRSKVPYLWGGGHGSIAKPGQPVDCSGFVSAMLGLKTPQVSGNLASWGQPGKGRWVTVYANSGHTFMSIKDPKSGKTRWFGTSASNPGGGAGEMPAPSASYLSRFAARHPG